MKNFFLMFVFMFICAAFQPVLAGKNFAKSQHIAASIEKQYTQVETNPAQKNPTFWNKVIKNAKTFFISEEGKVNMFAVAAGVLGIVATVALLPFVGQYLVILLLPLTTIILGVLGLVQAKKRGEAGKGWAIAGIIGGILGGLGGIITIAILGFAIFG